MEIKDKLASRKFILVAFCLIVATVALFTTDTSFLHWAGYTITVLTGYGVINHQAKQILKNLEK